MLDPGLFVDDRRPCRFDGSSFGQFAWEPTKLRYAEKLSPASDKSREINRKYTTSLLLYQPRGRRK
jgi:hypothetical protein